MPAVPLSRSDIVHLHQQLSTATKKKLDLFLPNADPDDALKLRVGAHVDEFVLELFGALDGNVVVDGTDAPIREIVSGGSQHVETEPFDFSLAEKVRKLWAQVEQETVKLAELRKNGPESVKRKYEESFDSVLEETLRETEEEEESVVGDEDGPKIARLEEIEQTYKEAIERVLALKSEIPEQRNELVKIEKVAKFLSEQ